MKYLLFLLVFSSSAFAGDSCEALIEEFKIDPQNRDGSVRYFTLRGKTSEQKECVVRFLPDFCSFQLEAPLEKPEMYYLSDTSVSSVKIKFHRGEKFFVKTVTKESKGAGLGQYTKVLDLEKSDKGYALKYKLQDGRFIRTDIKSYSCIIAPDLGPK